MAQNIISPEQELRINQLLEQAKELREVMVRGKIAGIVTDAEIKAHDEAIQKLMNIKRQFIDLAK